MKPVLLLAAVAIVAGCQSSETMYQRAADSWKGRPVREFVEYRSLLPTSYYDTETGRTFIFETVAPAGNRCGLTIKGVPNADRTQFLIGGLMTNCPALFL